MSRDPDERDEAEDRGPIPEEPFNPSMLIFICGIVAAAIVLGLLIN